MSLPSDVTPDIPPNEHSGAPRLPRERSQMTRDEQGWLVAALVAFLGIAYVGPAIARYRRRPSLKTRVARRWDEAGRQARGLRRKAGKRLRRLGGGSFRR